MIWLLVVLTCLAIFRVTRFLVEDKIIEKQRIKLYSWICTRDIPKTAEDYLEWRSARLNNIVSKTEPEPLMAYFITCPWCVSIWTGAIITGIVWFSTDLPYPVLTWLASSAVTGLLSSVRTG